MDNNIVIKMNNSTSVITRSEATKQSGKGNISARTVCFIEKWIASHGLCPWLAMTRFLFYGFRIQARTNVLEFGMTCFYSLC